MISRSNSYTFLYPTTRSKQKVKTTFGDMRVRWTSPSKRERKIEKENIKFTTRITGIEFKLVQIIWNMAKLHSARWDQKWKKKMRTNVVMSWFIGTRKGWLR